MACCNSCGNGAPNGTGSVPVTVAALQPAVTLPAPDQFQFGATAVTTPVAAPRNGLFWLVVVALIAYHIGARS